MAIDIAIDAEEAMASPALVPPTLTNPPRLLRPLASILQLLPSQPPLFRIRRARDLRKRGHAREAGMLARSFRGTGPGDLGPVLQGEEMVVGAREMGGEDEGEAAGGTRGGEVADLAPAAGAEVAAAGGLGVAGAEGLEGLDDARGEAHHEERTVVGAGGRVCCCGVGGCGRWRRCGGHDELSVVLLVEGDVVEGCGVDGRIGAGDERAADGDLCCEPDDGTRYLGLYQGCYGGVDVSRIGG